MVLDGAMLKQRRLELGLTQQEVADAAGVLRGTVLKWENGTIKTIRSDKIADVARVLKIPTSAILGVGEETGMREPETPVLTERQKVLFDASEKLNDQEMDAVMAMIRAFQSTKRD